MKIKIEFTVHVDQDAWMENYGVLPFQVRDDVKSYVINGALHQLDEVGVLDRAKHGLDNV